MEWGRHLALLTHDDGQRQETTAVAVDLLVECLVARDDLMWAIKRVIYGMSNQLKENIWLAYVEGSQAPCVAEKLERLAPSKSASSALAGGIYVALSFPDEDIVQEALEFAGSAPDGDSVATVTGAILGARHGYEALPTKWLARLELGWTMDHLATDIAAELVERQGGTAWKDDHGDVPALDPWWDRKYPGIQSAGLRPTWTAESASPSTRV